MGARELAQEDENMQAMRSVPRHAAAVKINDVAYNPLCRCVWPLTNKKITIIHPLVVDFCL